MNLQEKVLQGLHVSNKYKHMVFADNKKHNIVKHMNSPKITELISVVTEKLCIRTEYRYEEGLLGSLTQYDCLVLQVSPKRYFKDSRWQQFVVLHELSHAVFRLTKMSRGRTAQVFRPKYPRHTKKVKDILEEIVVEMTSIKIFLFFEPMPYKSFFSPSFYYMRTMLAGLNRYGIKHNNYQKILDNCDKKANRLMVSMLCLSASNDNSV